MPWIWASSLQRCRRYLNDGAARALPTCGRGGCQCHHQAPSPVPWSGLYLSQKPSVEAGFSATYLGASLSEGYVHKSDVVIGQDLYNVAGYRFQRNSVKNSAVVMSHTLTYSPLSSTPGSSNLLTWQHHLHARRRTGRCRRRDVSQLHLRGDLRASYHGHRPQRPRIRRWIWIPPRHGTGGETPTP